MFLLSPSLLITPLARASWGFCLIRDAWGLCMHRADERSAVRRQTARKQKDSFSCARTLEQSRRQLFPSRVSRSRFYPVHCARDWFMKIWKGKCKGPPKWYREEDTRLIKPLLLFTRITGILERQRHPATTEDALLSLGPRLIRANDFSATARLTHGGWDCG